MTKKLFARSIVLVVLLASAAAAFAQAGAPPASPPANLDAAREACKAAMNADPTFEAYIVKIADEKAQQKRDQDTIDAHNDAYHHIQKNERHVIYAYAGMWIVAAAFVIFLWRRQQALKLEIAQLRRDLEAAAGDAKPAGRS